MCAKDLKTQYIGRDGGREEAGGKRDRGKKREEGAEREGERIS